MLRRAPVLATLSVSVVLSLLGFAACTDEGELEGPPATSQGGAPLGGSSQGAAGGGGGAAGGEGGGGQGGAMGGGGQGGGGQGGAVGGGGQGGGGGSSAAELCVATGGTVESALCCHATDAFPDTCAVGACGCSPENSHDVAVCVCPGCFDPALGCVTQ